MRYLNFVLLFGVALLFIGVAIVASAPPPLYTATVNATQQATFARHDITTFTSSAVGCTQTECMFNMSYGNATDVFHTSELHLAKYMRRQNFTIATTPQQIGTLHDQAIQKYVDETGNAYAQKDARDDLAAATAPPITVIRQEGGVTLVPRP